MSFFIECKMSNLYKTVPAFSFQSEREMMDKFQMDKYCAEIHKLIHIYIF